MAIDLPPEYTTTHAYAAKLHAFLSSPFVQALLNAHPNEVAIHAPPQKLALWWEWALALPMSDVLDLALGTPSCALLASTSRLLDDVQRLRLPRTSPTRPAHTGHLPKGQTPKKAHEVSRFTHLVSCLCSHTGARRVVDVGAGQGHLSMALASSPYNLEVLALDSSEVQTSGSIHWASSAKEKDLKLTHKTEHISAETLPGLISTWLDDTGSEDRDVIVVGLHACGSLTPQTLLACTSNILSPSPSPFRIRACALIGCCYNLLSPPDTHLSSLPSPNLPQSALHLAAQPWLPPTRASLSLSLRKITYRALLARALHRQGIALGPEKRVGRLKDTVYGSWEAYVGAASARLGLRTPLDVELDEGEQRLCAGLAMLHVLRTALGPVIESWILLDRYVWLCELVRDREGEDGEKVEVGLEWVFDEGVSPRGSVLVVKA